MVKPCDENLLSVIKMADEMLAMAEKGDLEREDTGCGILYGVLRDAAFKIHKLATVEIRRHNQKQQATRICDKEKTTAYLHLE